MVSGSNGDQKARLMSEWTIGFLKERFKKHEPFLHVGEATGRKSGYQHRLRPELGASRTALLENLTGFTEEDSTLALRIINSISIGTSLASFLASQAYLFATWLARHI